MKKIIFVLVLALVSFLFIFKVKPGLTGVYIFFNYQEASEVYIKFAYELGSEFGIRAKQYRFLGEYKVKILQGMASIISRERMEKELVIVALINEEKIPFVWVKVRDLSNEEKIKEKAKEFSNKIFEKLRELEKLKELEKKRERKVTKFII